MEQDIKKVRVPSEVEDHFEEVIDSYEERLQTYRPDFKLSKFEKLIMLEAMRYGYEYAKNGGKQ